MLLPLLLMNDLLCNVLCQLGLIFGPQVNRVSGPVVRYVEGRAGFARNIARTERLRIWQTAATESNCDILQGLDVSDYGWGCVD